MKNSKKIAAFIAAIATTVTVSGCAFAPAEEGNEFDPVIGEEETLPEIGSAAQPEQTEPNENVNETEQPTLPAVKPEPLPPAKEKTVSYLAVSSSDVNLRSGAGTGYAVRGTAEKSTLYADMGGNEDWAKTYYKNKTAYISCKYCGKVEMKSSGDERIEAVIAEGAKLLGTAYVYGAARLHDGSGNMIKSFSTSAFDCSSLMQYIFYKGAGKLLQVNTRTQIYQGTTVSRQNLKRGDLMFFTNASRYNNKGVERVGHVALYLGDGWILHTASDYAKIEKISAKRWSYFIQGQRII